jgi:hypothetical protein
MTTLKKRVVVCFSRRSIGRGDYFMRNRILSVLISCAALLLLPILSATAQTRGKLTAEIPFAFSIGSKTLPAGTYTIERMTYNNPEKLIIRSLDTRTSAVLAVNDVPLNYTSTDTQLGFNKVGDSYFLRDIKVAGKSVASQLPATRDERRMERAEVESAQTVIIQANSGSR